MRLSDFDYDLPDDRIARHPVPERDASRLLVLDRSSGTLVHRVFRDLPELLRPGDCLVLNETRVRRARVRARRASGGRVELLVVRALDATTWEAMARPARRLAAGERLALERRTSAVAEIAERLPTGRLRIALRDAGGAVLGLDEVGEPPLPPYLGRVAEPEDDARYQTVYARAEGAVAAPTAGLHFTDDLLAEIEARGVAIARLTLHVGPGTFRPVTEDDVERHEMEAETYVYPEAAASAIDRARRGCGRIVAVGTTSTRVLETVGPDAPPGAGETCLYVRPPYAFRVVDALVTNFHLPRSTLLMLVSAFAGRGPVLAAYREAIAAGYRFYSYGDAMLIL